MHAGVGFGLIVSCIFAIGVAAIHANLIIFPIVTSSEVSYFDGLDDDRVLVGASHNVFVAKVLKKVGQPVGEAGILTQFEVQIVSNIKGTLSGKIFVSQEGGYENGILRLVENQPLLSVGTTYLLTTRGNEKMGYLATAYPRDWFVVSTDANLTLQQLQVLAAKDKMVLSLQDAYAHEIPFQIDVDTGHDYNSYASTLAE